MDIKKIIKEEVNVFKITNESPCIRFVGKNKDVCTKIHSLGKWLYEPNGLNLKNIINDMLKPISSEMDIIGNLQKPLALLYQNGSFNDITLIDGVYTTPQLKSKHLVFDDKQNWHPVNKLNTNYADLADLITEYLIKNNNEIQQLYNLSVNEIREYLMDNRDVFKELLIRYFDVEDLKDFTYNIKRLSKIGLRVENAVKRILENAGMTTLYQGGDGDFIDMIYGVDLIMSKSDKIYTVQIKSSPKILEKTRDEYPLIDFIVTPIISNKTIVGCSLLNKEKRRWDFGTDGKILQ